MKPKLTDHTPAYLRTCFTFDPISEDPIWLPRPADTRFLRAWNSKFAGKVAGCLNHASGYRVVRLHDVLYSAHALRWYMEHGSLPEEIDHRNRIRHDNHLSNLRAATRALNKYNGSLRKNNTTGYRGISWEPRQQMWVVRLQQHRRQQVYRTFKNLNDAVVVRREVELKYFGEFAPT